MKNFFVVTSLILCCLTNNLLSMQQGGASAEAIVPRVQVVNGFFDHVVIGDSEYVERFLRAVDVPSMLDICNAQGDTPLHIAVQYICSLKNRTLGVALTEAERPLYNAYLKIVRSILVFYAHTYSAASMLARQNFLGFTPFIEAAYGGNAECVAAFLAARDARDRFIVNVNAGDGEGYTGLMWASSQGYDDVVDLLLADNRTMVNVKTNKADTALILAAAHNHVDCVRLLLCHRSSIDGFVDVDLNLATVDGKSALWFAIVNQSQEVFDLLINARDEFGFLRLDIACLQSVQDLVRTNGLENMCVQIDAAIEELQNDARREGRG